MTNPSKVTPTKHYPLFHHLGSFQELVPITILFTYLFSLPLPPTEILMRAEIMLLDYIQRDFPIPATIFLIQI